LFLSNSLQLGDTTLSAADKWFQECPIIAHFQGSQVNLQSWTKVLGRKHHFRDNPLPLFNVGFSRKNMVTYLA